MTSSWKLRLTELLMTCTIHEAGNLKLHPQEDYLGNGRQAENIYSWETVCCRCRVCTEFETSTGWTEDGLTFHSRPQRRLKFGLYMFIYIHKIWGIQMCVEGQFFFFYDLICVSWWMHFEKTRIKSDTNPHQGSFNLSELPYDGLEIIIIKNLYSCSSLKSTEAPSEEMIQPAPWQHVSAPKPSSSLCSFSGHQMQPERRQFGLYRKIERNVLDYFFFKPKKFLSGRDEWRFSLLCDDFFIVFKMVLQCMF